MALLKEAHHHGPVWSFASYRPFSVPLSMVEDVIFSFLFQLLCLLFAVMLSPPLGILNLWKPKLDKPFLL